VKDLATGQLLPDPVTSSTGDFTFSPDSRWLFWTFRDENGRPTKIFRRPCAARSRRRAGLRGGRRGHVHRVGRTADDRFIVISSGNQETSEARYIPLRT
jgi:oligopeptidase B